MAEDDKVTCHTPTPGKKPTRIPRWKYDCIRSAILGAVGEAGEEGFAMSDLYPAVAARLSKDQLADLGSVTWHTMSVKLNMECEGELHRLPNVTPQRLVTNRPAR